MKKKTVFFLTKFNVEFPRIVLNFKSIGSASKIFESFESGDFEKFRIGDVIKMRSDL